MLPSARPEITRVVSASHLDGVTGEHDAVAVGKHSRIEDFAARALCRYLQSAATRGSIAWIDRDGRIRDQGVVNASIASLLPAAQRIILTYWIADALAVALLPVMHDAFGRLFSALTCVIDDTFEGRIAGRYIEAIGGRYATLALPGDDARLHQLLAFMRQRTSCAFPVDGGGPYRCVDTGIISLSMTLRAPIVPLAAIARPAFPPIHRSMVRLPAPTPRVFAAIGTPLHVDEGDRRAQAGRVAAELNSLAAAVRRAARHQRAVS